MKTFPRAALSGLILIVIALHIKPVPSKAQTFNGVTSAGMGGAGRAAVDTIDVGRLNPAGLTHLRSYSFGANYRERHYSKEMQGSSWAVSLADNSSGVAFPGGFTYEKRFKYIGGERLEQDHYFISIAQRLRPNLGFGLTLHHQRTRALVGEGSTIVQGDLGLLWTPSPALGFGAVAYNLAGSKDRIPSTSNLYRTGAFGAHWILAELLRVRADYLYQMEENPDSRGSVMAGFESMVFPWMALRAGWMEDGLQNFRAWTLGWGFDGPRLKLNVSAQLPMESSLDTRYSVDMLMQF